jgi:phospholipase C
VYGPNGFVRTFKGNAEQQAKAPFNPEIQVCYEPTGDRLYVKVHNAGLAGGSVKVEANAYRTDGPWTIKVAARAVGMLDWNISSSGQWYDFTASTAFTERRLAGRMETGQHGISDPAMATTPAGSA